MIQMKGTLRENYVYMSNRVNIENIYNAIRGKLL